MSNVGQRERATQNRIVQFFQTDLGYRYLGDWQDRANNKNIEVDILVNWLKKRGVSEAGNDSNLLIVFYVQIMPDDFVMQLHRF